MGVFTYQIEIGAFPGGRFEAMDAFVDSGAFYTQVPAEVLRSLGVEVTDSARFATADGRHIESDLGTVRIRIDGRETWTICIFGEEGTSPLLGAYALEGFRLGIDPVNQRLIPIEGVRLGRRVEGPLDEHP